MQNGYYYAQVKEVTVECYQPPSDVASQNGDKSYYYTSIAGLESDVAIGDNNTILDSIYASGDDPNYNPFKATGTKATATPTITAQTVPGLSGGGTQQLGGQSGDGTGNSDASASGSAQSGNGGFDSPGGLAFIQGNPSEASTVVAGSAVALLGFFVAALVL